MPFCIVLAIIFFLPVNITSAAAPAVLPSGISAYTNLNLSASWNVGHGAYVQQMVNLTESNTIYGSYIAASNSIANFEYFYGNGTVIPAWIESNSSGKLITWLKIKNTTATNGIYLGFASKTTNLLSSSGTTGIGEAPQLSSTYAEYDDGASVFTHYWDFAGTALPSGWTGVNYTVNNGVTVKAPGATNLLNYINTTSAIYNTTQITEFYFPSGFAFGSPIGGTTGIGEGWGLGKAPNTFGNNGISVYNDYHYGATFFQTAFNAASNVSSTFTTGPSSFISSMYSTSSNAVFGIGTNPPNYNNAHNAILTKDVYVGNSFISLSSYDSDTKIGPIDYIRTRAYPSSGVMPSVSFGAVQTVVPTLIITHNPATYGSSITITATCLGGGTCAIDYPSLGTAIVTGTGSATYTYNAFALGVGTYSSFYANDITAGTNSTGQTLTISKATPVITLPNFPANYVYNGINATATANIISYNNQLSANAFVNNVLITSFDTANTVTLGASAGNYIFTANTLGNGNYTSASVTNTLTISKAAPAILLLFKNYTSSVSLDATGAEKTINSTLPFNITASLDTVNNQLNAGIYVNASLNATTNSLKIISFSVGSLSVGKHVITFNSLGNNNYTSFDSAFIINASAQPSSNRGPVINSAFTVENNIVLQVLRSVTNKVNFENYNITLKFVTNYTGKANLSIIKETPSFKSYPGCSSVTSVFLINASVGGAPLNVSLPYTSSDVRANLLLAICKNNRWELIKNYTINPYAHTINFITPIYSIIGFVPPNYTTSITTSVTTSTTVSSTSTTKTTTKSTSTIPSVKSTISSTTIVPTTTILKHPEKLNADYIILLIAFAIVLIIIGAYYLISKHKARVKK